MNFGITTQRRIQACYESGLHWSNWYDSAYQSVLDWVGEKKTSAERLTGLLSIASPRVQVSRSIKIAKHFFETQQKLGGTMTAIFDRMVDFWSSPKTFIWSRKVGAFNRAILGDASAVVVDIHISRAFGFDDGYPMRTNPAAVATNDSIVEFISSMNVETSPRDTQAAIWCGWLRFNGKEIGELKL